MAKSNNAPGWTYSHSDALAMDYAYRPSPIGIGVEVMTADKVRYSPAEVSRLSEAGVEISLGVHLVKKVFHGEIVETMPLKAIFSDPV